MAHPLARRRGLAGDEGGHRLGELARGLELGRLLLGVAADLAHHEYSVGVRVGLEQGQDVNEARAVDRVAADAHAGALADAQTGKLPDRLIRERAGTADNAHPARLVDIAGHDADLALTRCDDARAVRAD